VTMPRVIGIVTARRGSKGLPGKNVALLGSRPLVGWTFDAARGSRALSRVVVSTDDPAVADLAAAAGVDVPFMRPAELAADDTPTAEVVRHALTVLAAEGDRPDYVVVLQPTSPFRAASDIDAAVAVAVDGGAPMVVSVTEMHGHPSWTMRIDAAGWLVPWNGAAVNDRRQDRNAAFVPNGAVFVVRADVATSTGDWYAAGVRPYVMPPERSLDIDTPWDLQIARAVVAHSG